MSAVPILRPERPKFANGAEQVVWPAVSDHSRERLYVGLSRARDQLVVCGDPALIEEAAGPDVARLLRAAG